jgi:hypothetical protein
LIACRLKRCKTYVSEVLLLQDGEQEAGHGIIAVRRHDDELVAEWAVCVEKDGKCTS